MVDAVLVGPEEGEASGAATRHDRDTFDRVGLGFQPGAQSMSRLMVRGPLLLLVAEGLFALGTEPDAIGGPISILESGRTMIKSFFEAGTWALGSIAILLWIVLRRFGDVLLTLIPLILAGVVTLQLMVIFGMKLNFANIIALPLLLGLGVAFKIYYIMAWRAGQTDLLQSSLTRAVFFSALTTATAFGSLWLSSHPGTSSMGKLMALALVTTMCAAVLFQPVLMGPPREKIEH